MLLQDAAYWLNPWKTGQLVSRSIAAVTADSLHHVCTGNLGRRPSPEAGGPAADQISAISRAERNRVEARRSARHIGSTVAASDESIGPANMTSVQHGLSRNAMSNTWHCDGALSSAMCTATSLSTTTSCTYVPSDCAAERSIRSASVARLLSCAVHSNRHSCVGTNAHRDPD